MKDTIRYARRYIALLLTVVTLFGSLTACGKQTGSSVTPGSSILQAPTKSVTEAETKDANSIEMTGVLTYVDTSEYMMHFMDVDTGTEYEVAYTGGTDIQDKYQKIMAASTMQIGDIFDVTCNKTGKAEKIYESQTAWEKTGVSDLSVDESARKITSGANSYLYDSHAVILSDSQKISIAQLVSSDEITLRGIDDTVYSVSVEQGHGYLQFTGIDSFIGGYAGIGNKLLLSVSSGMLVTAPEGTYTVELQKGSLVGQRTVTVTRDQQTSVDFSDYTTAAVQTGTVNFSITPAGAILSIDGVETDYSEPLTLTYGKHSIVLQANYYEEYTETLTVSSSYQTKVIDMTASTASTTSSSSTTSTTSSSGTTTAADLTDGYSVNVTAPEGASLYVDSVYIGIIPCSFSKSSGNKTITLTQNGYDTISYTIAVQNASGNLTYSFPSMVESTE